MMDITAFKYRLNDGREMFMSSATVERVKDILVVVVSSMHILFMCIRGTHFYHFSDNTYS